MPPSGPSSGQSPHLRDQCALLSARRPSAASGQRTVAVTVVSGLIENHIAVLGNWSGHIIAYAVRRRTIVLSAWFRPARVTYDDPLGGSRPTGRVSGMELVHSGKV